MPVAKYGDNLLYLLQNHKVVLVVQGEEAKETKANTKAAGTDDDDFIKTLKAARQRKESNFLPDTSDFRVYHWRPFHPDSDLIALGNCPMLWQPSVCKFSNEEWVSKWVSAPGARQGRGLITSTHLRSCNPLKLQNGEGMMLTVDLDFNDWVWHNSFIPDDKVEAKEVVLNNFIMASQQRRATPTRKGGENIHRLVLMSAFKLDRDSKICIFMQRTGQTKIRCRPTSCALYWWLHSSSQSDQWPKWIFWVRPQGVIPCGEGGCLLFGPHPEADVLPPGQASEAVSQR